TGGVPAGMAILEQGSGACIWRDDCDSTYQPGISDHDYEVFFPAWGADDANAPAQVACVIKALNKVFEDPAGIEIDVGGSTSTVVFDDVTFYPVALEALR